MAKKAGGGVNRSQEIRELYKANPNMTAKEVVETLRAKGVDVKPGLVYLIKGKIAGRKSRGRRKRRQVAAVAAVAVRTSSNGNVLATIKKIKALAADLGGISKLKDLVDVLAE